MSMNESGNSSGDCPPGSLLDRPPIRITLICCYILVFLIVLIGNFVLLSAIIGQKHMRNVTNFFLANLAAADLLVGVFCVLQNLCQLLVFSNGHWPLGASLCHLYVFVLHLVPCTSAGILILVAIERYVAVLHPMIAKQLLTRKLIAALTALVWMTSFLANIPYYLTTKHYQWTHLAACGRDFSSWLDLGILYRLSFFLWYCIPLGTLVVLYSKISRFLWLSTRRGILIEAANEGSERVKDEDSLTETKDNGEPFRFRTRSNTVSRMLEARKRVIRLLVGVTLAFGLLTLPWHARLLWTSAKSSFCLSSPSALFQPASYLLLFTNSGINPILYAFMSAKFRNAVKATFRLRKDHQLQLTRRRNLNTESNF